MQDTDYHKTLQNLFDGLHDQHTVAHAALDSMDTDDPRWHFLHVITTTISGISSLVYEAGNLGGQYDNGCRRTDVTIQTGRHNA
jgi:hypothetical protein